MKKYFYILLFLLLIASCSKNIEVLTKKEIPTQFDINEIDQVEDKIIEKNENLIQLSLPHQEINIQINNIPILKEYLQVSSDKEAAIKNMNLIPIELPLEPIYLLEFSCYNNQCSYLLFDHKNEQASQLLADLAEYVDYVLSPHQSKILFHFKRRNFQFIPSSNLIVFDLNSWEMIPIENEALKHNFSHFKWAVSSVDWIDEHTISVILPLIHDKNRTDIFTYENLYTESTEIIVPIGQ